MRAWLAAAATALFCTAASAADRCPIEEGVAGQPAPLTHTAPLLAAGHTIDVLVIGSATVFGPEASLQAGTITSRATGLPGVATTAVTPSLDAFPNVMGRTIEQAVPGVTVQVTIRGARSMAAADMLGLLHGELAAKHYQLIIWQTGTVEAVRNVLPGDFAQTLADGEQMAEEAGADLVLVDPQYSRFLQTNADLGPYLMAFQQAATAPDVVWFRRWDLMRGWVGAGGIDLERTPRSERLAAVTALHACLGSQLAHLVIGSVRN